MFISNENLPISMKIFLISIKITIINASPFKINKFQNYIKPKQNKITYVSAQVLCKSTNTKIYKLFKFIIYNN